MGLLKAHAKLDRDHPRGLMNLGPRPQHAIQGLVARGPGDSRRSIQQQLQRDIGERQRIGQILRSQRARPRPVQREDPHLDGASLQGEREHGPGTGRHGGRHKPRPLRRQRVQLRGQRRRPEPEAVRIRPFPHRELILLQLGTHVIRSTHRLSRHRTAYRRHARAIHPEPQHRGTAQRRNRHGRVTIMGRGDPRPDLDRPLVHPFSILAPAPDHAGLSR
jgi:hypothetical protein